MELGFKVFEHAAALIGRAQGGELVISTEGGKLFAAATDVFQKSEIVALTPTKFLAPATGLEFTAIPGKKGGVAAIDIGGNKLPRKGK